jgi:hypothetical protein
MKLVLELDESPDLEARLVYMAVSDMFNVDLEIDGCDILLEGPEKDVTAWIAFHILPMDVIEV